MNNTLTNEEREKLAGLAGGKTLLIDWVQHWEFDDPRIKKPLAELGDEPCENLFIYHPPKSQWLSGDLTPPESYYQAHLVLEGVRAKGFAVQATFSEILGDIVLNQNKEWSIFAETAASPEQVCRAALELLGAS